MAKRADITEDKILTDYQVALDLAKTQEKPDSVVNAATAQAKLVGLLRDRTEVGKPGDFEQLESVSEILEKVSQEAGPEAASALAAAMGIDKPRAALPATRLKSPKGAVYGDKARRAVPLNDFRKEARRILGPQAMWSLRQSSPSCPPATDAIPPTADIRLQRKTGR